jgi:acetyl-CoA carboxylase biotin carboxyl carrier protein
MSTKKTGIDQQLIRDLAGILDATNLSEIEVEQGDLRIRVSRQINVQAYAGPAPTPSAFAPAAPSGAPGPAAGAPAAAPRSARPSARARRC